MKDVFRQIAGSVDVKDLAGALSVRPSSVSAVLGQVIVQDGWRICVDSFFRQKK